jgi:hypothetical protein
MSINAINSDAHKLRSAPLLRAGYGERYVPEMEVMNNEYC